MEQLKRGMEVGDKTAFDLVGQTRQLQLTLIFPYESCTIPSSLIDEYGCLRKRNKSTLVNRLGVKQVSGPGPDIVRVDMQQMLYHIVRSHGGDASNLSEHIKRRLSCYCAGTEQVPVFHI